LIFDSVFDIYRGVVAYSRVFSGRIVAGQAVKLMSTGKSYEIKEVGIFTPKPLAQESLEEGDVGYFIANIKSTSEIKIGDTLTDQRNPAPEQLSENRPGKTADQRFRLRLSGGEFRGLRLRFSLWFSRFAPHGDRTGATTPGVRYGHHRDLPERGLRGATDQRGEGRS
jgi:hypothetical protein